MPRPKHPDRETVVVAKVSYEELELIRQASHLRDQTMSGFVRSLVLKAARHEIEGAQHG